MVPNITGLLRAGSIPATSTQMTDNDALENVTEVSVTASEKRMLDDYEPYESRVTVTAEVGEDDDVDSIEAELTEWVSAKVTENVLERYEAYIRKEMDE